jgi:hypothetical protein
MFARMTISPTGCWLWPGATNEKGYGIIGQPDGSTARVHCVSYEWYFGPIKNEVDHRCRVRRCFCPDHLRDVTHQINC